MSLKRTSDRWFFFAIFAIILRFYDIDNRPANFFILGGEDETDI
jgi:hypothetical protein